MSMDETGLHVSITADAASASTAVADLDACLAKIEKAFQGAAKGAENAGKSAEKAGGLFGKLSSVFKDVEEHSRTASMALNQVGLHSDAAVAKVSGLGQLFKGLGSATPMLLGVGAAIAAIGTSAAFLKESADKAAQWQQKMDILGRTVRDQGGNWNIARKGVEEFADSQERATTFSRDQVVQAITQMTSAGMSYKDAMAEVRVAEDASSATGQDLMTVSHGLVEALHGRTQALTMLGIGTKQSIHQGMTLYSMNAAIEKQMGGSAGAAAEGYAGKMQQLHNAFESLQEKIGSAVLPVLTKLADTLVSMVDAAEKQFDKWEAAAHQFYVRNKQAFDALGHAVEVVWGVIKGVTQAGWATVTGIWKTQLGIVMDVFTAFSDLFTGHANQFWGDVGHIFTDAWHNLTSGFGNFGDNLITIAERIAKAVAHAFEAPFAAMADAMHGNLAKAKSDLAGTFSGFGGLTSGLKPWTMGGGATHEEAASNPLLHLSAAAGDIMAGGPSSGSKGAARALHHIAKAAHTAKTHVEKLHKAITDLYSIGDPFAKLIKQANAASSKTPALLAATEKQEFNSFFAGFKDAQTEQRDLQKNLDDAQKKWDQYYNALEQNAQKWTDKTATFIEGMFAKGKNHAHAFADEFKAILKQIEEALLKSALFEMFMGGQGSHGPSFMSVFAKNMGFGSNGAASPGSAPGGMGAMSLATTAISMFGGSHEGALSGIASMFGGGKASSASGANGSGGIIGALIGVSSATQLASSLPTDSVMSMLFGVGAPSTPGLGGSDTGSGGLGGVTSVIAGGNGPGGGTFAGAAGSVLGANAGNIMSLISSNPYILGSLLDIGAGEGFGALFHGGNNDGSTYGTWGGIGGLLLGLPGAIVGSLFGHKDNPKNMPDKYDTQNYGTIISDLIGHAGANGQNFYEGQNGSDSALPSASGGKTGIAWIEETLAQYANPDGSPGPNTPDWLKPMWSQLVGAFGISSSGSGQLNFGHAINNEWITGAQGVTNSSSNPLQYTDFGNLLDQFFMNYMTQGTVGIGTPNTTPMPGSGNGFGVTSPFATSYVVGYPGSAPQLVSGTGSGLPTFNLGPDPNAGGSETTGPGLAPAVPSTPAKPTHPHPKHGPTKSDYSTGVHVTVNVGGVHVGGNVTAENDLADTIHKKIVESLQHNLNAHDMALHGIGV